MAKPGVVVLKRPVGSHGPFTEHADLPTDLGNEGSDGRPRKERAKPKQRPSRKTDDKAAARKAALEYEKEEKRRKIERQREEAAREKEDQRRQQAVDKAQVAVDKAKGDMRRSRRRIDTERQSLEKGRRPRVPLVLTSSAQNLRDRPGAP
jgi:hypothetical protein